MDYAHIYKEIILVTPFETKTDNEIVMPIEDGIMHSNLTGKKIMTFGLPKKLRKYIEKNTKNIFTAEKSKNKFTVMSPNAGFIIEKAEKKDTPEKLYPSGVYVMTEAEKDIYKEYFSCGEI